MTLVSIWPIAAARLRRASRAIQRFFGPIEPNGAQRRVHVPFCVSYGRAVFCLHAHEPRSPNADATTRH